MVKPRVATEVVLNFEVVEILKFRTVFGLLQDFVLSNLV